VLLGPTLSGKTSIMRLLAGLDKPSTGRVLSDGKGCHRYRRAAALVAMVYRSSSIYPSLTVYENIASLLRCRQAAPEIEKRVAERETAAIGAVSGAHAAAASGGQRSAPRSARGAGEGRRSRAARRALANLVTSCARSCAPNCRASSRPPARSSSTPPRAVEPCCSAAAPSACGKAKSCRPATRRRSTAIPTPCASHRCSPIPAQSRLCEKRDGVIQYASGVVAPRRAFMRSSTNGEYRVGFRAIKLELANGQPGRHVFPSTVSSPRSPVRKASCISPRGPHWVAVLHGVHEYEPGACAPRRARSRQCLRVRRPRPAGWSLSPVP